MHRSSQPTSLFRTALAVGAALLVAGTFIGTASAAAAASNKTVNAFVPGELLIRFQDGTSRSNRDSVLAAEGLEVVREYQLTGLVHVRGAGDVSAAIIALSKAPELLYAEPNYIVYPTATPDDPSYSQMYGLNNTGQTGGTADADIDAPEAWDLQTGSSSIIVGIIDTGIDIDHPDLLPNLWVNPGEIAGNNIDDDMNGYVDDIHGINAATGSGNPNDEGVDSGHGTHVSGTVGAKGNNASQVVGVAWNVQLMGCRFLVPSGSTADAIECVEYTAMMGANLTNNSWGGGGFSQALKDAIDAAGAQDILFVAAAGNDASDIDSSPHYPASYTSPTLLAVASTTNNDTLSGFSNYGGTAVDVAAPGSNILSTWNDGGTNTISGTSMASPHVAGIAALVLSSSPGLSALDLKARIMDSVDPLGLDIVTGGRVNALSALGGLTDPFLFTPVAPVAEAGEQLALDGSNFGDVQGSGFVDFGGIQPPITSWSDSEVVFDVPALPPGTYDVFVTTDDAGDTNTIEITLAIAHYIESSSANVWLEEGTPMGWQADDACWHYALPSAFNFFGDTYTQVAVCSNGFLDFASDNPDFTNSTEEFLGRKMIAPMWDDLRTDLAGGDIYIAQLTATTVMFRWAGVRFDPQIPVNFAVVLDLESGSIHFLYGGGNSNLSPTVGVSKGNTTDFDLAVHNNTFLLDFADRVEYTAQCVDTDGDGYGSTGAPTCPNGVAIDCNDADGAVNPGATEIPFNGIDDDCDASTPQIGCQSVAVLDAEPTTRPWTVALGLVPAIVLFGVARNRRSRNRRA